MIFASAFGADTVTVPTINLSLSAPDTPQQLVTSLNVLVVLTILALAPSLIFIMTSFLRLVIVFSFLRQAMGTQQMPPTSVLISIALILTFFIMEPVAKQSYEQGIKPYLDEQISYQEAFDKGAKPFKEFMIRNTREKDLALFYRIRQLPNPTTIDDVPLTIAAPAFIISELKTAFEIGFLLYLPFLVIDMVVSSVLINMVRISQTFKQNLLVRLHLLVLILGVE